MLDALSRARQAVFTADCWRSFFIIAIGTLLLLVYRAGKLKGWLTVALLLVLCLVDLWQVNRRYLNPDDKDQFVKKTERRQIRQMTEVDRQILDDPTLYYRVLNLAGNVFNENETSYYHKSVGGYHAAKLRRYQELIDAYISPQLSAVREVIPTYYGDLTQVNGDSIWSVLNMLNTKYFIYPGAQTPVQNPYVYGNPKSTVEDGLYYYDYLGKKENFKERNHVFTWFGPTNLGVHLTYDLLYRRIQKKGVSFNRSELYQRKKGGADE